MILGCTHYPLIRKIFERAFGRDVTLVFSAEETAREVAETLARKGVENERGREGGYRFLTTGDPEAFRELGRRFLQLPVRDVEHVTVATLEGRRMSERGRPQAGPAPRDLVRAGLPREPARLGRHHAGADEGALHGNGRGGRPRWLRDQGRGWITAEYSLLPASTGERVQREAARGKQQGRTVEIQRLIGRAVRAVADFEALGERTLWLDCDVLQADGGTRCAAICGAYVAAMRALERFGLSRTFRDSVAAVSVGVVDGVPLLDLDYAEDSSADTDMNVVMTGDGRLVEVQATAERDPFARETLDELLELAAAGIGEIAALQAEAVARELP